MTSDENSYSLTNNNLTTCTSSIINDTNLDTQILSLPTIIHITPNSNPLTSPTQLTDNQYEHAHIPKRQQVTVKKISQNYLRRRLCVREYYYVRLALVSNMMCFLGTLGILLMIIENELNFTHIYDKDSKVSWFIKLIITFTTAILLVLILYYHHLDITLYSYRNSLEKWSIAMTSKKILLIIIEILICAIHPIPRFYPKLNPETINSNSSESNSYSLSYTAIDVGLGLPMFLRLYLVGRCIMLHSHLVRDITLRSFGYLNHVPVDLYFLIKTYLEQWPTRCLFTFCITGFLIGSWSLRACDYKITREHMSFSDAMWLFIITFTTVGYGDLYPTTYCGRSIAALIGLFGLILSALLIAIIAQKLLLTRDEKYVHTFVLNTKLIRNRRNYAANVIKFAIKVWYLKRQNKHKSFQYFQAHRKLFGSIHHFQKIRQEQRNLDDQCVGFIELMALQQNTNIQAKEAIEQMMAFKNEVKEIKEELFSMNRNICNLQKTLHVLLEKGTI
ncbi:unnamed protein product [Adineta steineri]|uniref:Uncharacterized protein n=1 Tax=Adineta steineri TaxID=433720 RepID=A0A814G3V0_9BILA|nr:unnamed protein product [Adineta steineri]CAF0990917.1 unnamed protein product [Adineta steineri]